MLDAYFLPASCTWTDRAHLVGLTDVIAVMALLLLDDMVCKGLKLTVVLDSCHSGSISRGEDPVVRVTLSSSPQPNPQPLFSSPFHSYLPCHTYNTCQLYRTACFSSLFSFFFVHTRYLQLFPIFPLSLI